MLSSRPPPPPVAPLAIEARGRVEAEKIIILFSSPLPPSLLLQSWACLGLCYVNLTLHSVAGEERGGGKEKEVPTSSAAAAAAATLHFVDLPPLPSLSPIPNVTHTGGVEWWWWRWASI